MQIKFRYGNARCGIYRCSACNLDKCEECFKNKRLNLFIKYIYISNFINLFFHFLVMVLFSFHPFIFRFQSLKHEGAFHLNMDMSYPMDSFQPKHNCYHFYIYISFYQYTNHPHDTSSTYHNQFFIFI